MMRMLIQRLSQGWSNKRFAAGAVIVGVAGVLSFAVMSPNLPWAERAASFIGQDSVGSSGRTAVAPMPPTMRGAYPATESGVRPMDPYATGAPDAPAAATPSKAGAPAASPAGQAQAGTAAGTTGTTASSTFDRMIIYTTSLGVTVKDIGQAVSQVTEVAQRTGGAVVGTNVRHEGNFTFASLTLRVPAAAYHDAMTALRGIGVKVPTEQSNSQDITEEFADLDAQVRNLQVVEAQFQELMKRTVTLDEILRVQTQRNTVRGQIERLKGRVNYLQRNADLATITVNLMPEGAERIKPTASGGWNPAGIARESWQDSLDFLQAWVEGGIRVAVFMWWVLPSALIAWGIWSMFRNRRREAPAAPEGA